MIRTRWMAAIVAGTLANAAPAQRSEPAATPAPTSAMPSPPATSSSSDDIVVTGKRTTQDEVRDFVGMLDRAPGQRQLARFERDRVCPAAMGLPPAQRAAVAERLRKVAAAADIPVAKEGCRPNVVVLVTNDRPALMKALAGASSVYFPDLPREQVRALVAATTPAVAWQLLGAPLNADGVEMVRDRTTDTYVNPTTRRGSRITAAARPHIGGAIVVVQADALPGLTTTQLADYVAMRAFAGTDPAKLGRDALPTILKVFDAASDSEVPVTLTRWDLSLLRSLYASPSNLTAAAQRSAVSSAMLSVDGKDERD